MAMHFANASFYINDEDKTQSAALVGSYSYKVDTALQEMLATKRKLGKMDKRQGYHFIISLKTGSFNKVIQRSAAWREHTRIVRGNPVRIYEGEKFVLRKQQ